LQPAAHEAGNRRRSHGGDRTGVDARVVLERGDELAREQRVPARRPGALEANGVRGVLAQAAAHQLGDRGRTERRRPDDYRRLMIDQLGQRVGRRRGLAGADGEDRARRDLLDPRCEVGEEAKRIRVRPVRIVDQQGERALLRQPRAQPVQPVEPREQAILAGRPVGNLLEQRARQPCRAREGLVTLALRERLDHRRQKLEHHAERELALHRSAPRTEDGHPAGHLHGLSQQRALADAGRSLDHDDPSRTGHGPPERAADLLQLGLTLQ